MLTVDQKNSLARYKNDKEIKKAFKIIASHEYDKFYPTKELKKLGYIRGQCKKCGTYFWSQNEKRTICGDPMCVGGFNVSGNPLPTKLSYVDVWKKIVEILSPRNYKIIKRYPCIARWNPTSEFTIASISAFQPYVVSGEQPPPAKKLLIPQFCLRFNDIENVGVTPHCTGFVMIGQHSFVPPEEWDQGQLFLDMHDFITIGVGLSKDEITIHEDSWAGGGSFGCSLEFFSRGVELFNQVYTMFEQTPKGPKELRLKVLDMGLGQERVAWFSQGTPNMYEAVFPKVLSKLRSITNLTLDLDLYNKFSKYAAFLNIDEVEDMDSAWQRVADKLEINVKNLRDIIMPMTGLYSVAEHTRSLLFAIHDGKLPSNVGGGYNLRVIFRRAIGFIDKFQWDIDMADVCEWHAEELKELFPEVSDNLDEIREILNVEREKYYKTKKKAAKLVDRKLKSGKIDTDTLIEMYDSNGISPDMVKEAAKKYNITIKIPDNFYNLVVQRHEQEEHHIVTEKKFEIDLDDVPPTTSLYYTDYTKTQNKAQVLKIFDSKVIVDKSVAYPISGGQQHDVGTINGQRFEKVFKQGNHIIHELTKEPTFKEGDIVLIKVDDEWRKQLSQHHTATHIVNAAAREVLGHHINQAGAKKTLKNSHLDITHYEQLTNEQLQEIERRANEIVEKEIELNLQFMPRAEAEQKFGMTIYQGGAVPGSEIRIVEIPGIEVEACGGTHLNNTAEANHINLLKSQKIQDGIVRLTFTAGKASRQIAKKHEHIINELMGYLDVKKTHIFGRVQELFEKWKNINKALATGEVDKSDLTLTSTKEFSGDILNQLSNFLNIKKDNIVKKVKQFYNEWNEGKEKLDKMKQLLSDENIENMLSNAHFFRNMHLIIEEFRGLSQDDVKNLNQSILEKDANTISILINQTEKGYLMMGMMGSEAEKKLNLHLGNIIKDCVSHFGGKGGGSQVYGQGFIGRENIELKKIKEFIYKTLQE
ncbi:MAG: Alanine--tRNA ligase [Promethearchaeota archaeon]|nr:MAG: Alanine--tRNA ligase [Candidatus Lokiarchaeota archaeon]